jgi:hypothetical protein
MNKTKSTLTFILSTGRCGTQWIAQTLKKFYSEVLEVAHEPLHDAYEPRSMLAVSAGLSATPPRSVREHADRLTDLDKPYLEAGHPCWSSIPWLTRELGVRVRVVHLVRHPLPTSLSWLTHRAYEKPLMPHLNEKILLSPFDLGIAFDEYRSNWGRLTPIEKCLYYWTEVNAFALRIRCPAQSWLTVSYENLFSGNGLMDLLDFLELSPNPEVLAYRARCVDEYRYVTRSDQGWHMIENIPQTIDIAGQLGYKMPDVDKVSLHRRYIQGK